MAKIRFCNLCERNVAVKKKGSPNTLIVIVLTLCTFFGGILYYLWKKEHNNSGCPICGNTDLLPANTKAEILNANKNA